MTYDKTRLRFLAMIVSLFVPASAQAELLSEAPIALPPAAKWSDAVGPVFLSKYRLTFASGVSTALEELRDTNGVQWFRLKDPFIALPAGNGFGELKMCEGSGPTHVRFELDIGDGWSWVRFHFAKVVSAEELNNSDDSCSSLLYSLEKEHRAGFADAKIKPSEENTKKNQGRGSEDEEWRVSRSVNPLDDSATFVMSLASGTRAKFGETVRFIARCKSNKTEAFVVWHDYLGDNSRSVYSSWKSVTLRLGRSPAQTMKWDLSTDSKATFYPEWAGNLLREMYVHDQMVVQTTPYNESPVTAVFDIRGMEKGLRELSDTCNWSLN